MSDQDFWNSFSNGVSWDTVALPDLMESRGEPWSEEQKPNATAAGTGARGSATSPDWLDQAFGQKSDGTPTRSLNEIMGHLAKISLE